jgi:hypothetical protein
MLLVDTGTYLGKFVRIQPEFRIRNGFSTEPDPGFYLNTDPDPDQPCLPTKRVIFYMFAFLYGMQGTNSKHMVPWQK